MSTKEEFIKKALMGISEKHGYNVPINLIYSGVVTGRFKNKSHLTTIPKEENNK